jgi:hypothetical protein
MEWYKGSNESYHLIEQRYEFEASTDSLHLPMPPNYTSFTFYRGCLYWAFTWQCQVHVYPETQKRAVPFHNHTIATPRRPQPSPFAVVLGLILILVTMVVMFLCFAWLASVLAFLFCCVGVLSLFK